MLPNALGPLLALFFPQACQVCQNSVEKDEDGVACGECWQQTRLFTGRETLCAKCSAFLSARSAPERPRCHVCDDHFYDAAAAVGLYEKALAASVLRLKSEPRVARRLQNFLLDAYERSGFPPIDSIVPVPLAKKRLIERGFNQAEVLGAILARQTGIELDAQSLARRQDTPMHRGGMDRRARELSVAKAFEVRRTNFVKDRAVLLVDDVFTSGATVSACAQVLKKKGARGVYVLTLARAASIANFQ